ncbi:MAG: hypothetical protein JWL97_3045 [Gemmatimonadales bacterium]|nr:hypothetical protein [Gemmatimonadales bacterium]
MPKQHGLRVIGNRVTALAGAALLSGALNGCYEFVPAQTDVLVPGKPIALEINDQGRVGLGSEIGTEVRRLSGTLVSQSDQDFQLKVTELTFLNDRTSRWSGEQVRIPRQFARTVFEQRLSGGRTLMATAVSAGLIVAAIVVGKLSGRGGSGQDSSKPPPPPPGQ